MDIAFSAIILAVLVVIPGFIFFRIFTFEYSHVFKIKYDTPFRVVMVSIFPGIIIQVAGYLFCTEVLKKSINTENLLILLNGPGSPLDLAAAYQDIASHLSTIVLYNLSVWIFAAALGWFLYRLVRFFQWDYYLFSIPALFFYLIGEAERTRRKMKNPIPPGFIWVDIAVEIANQEVIYSGVVKEIEAKNAELVNIYLRGAERTTNLNREEERTDRVGVGDFVIPFSEIKNILITYFSISRDSDKKPA